MKTAVTIFIFIFFINIVSQSISAQAHKNAQVGDINVEEGKTENAYDLTQSQVIDFFTKFASRLENGNAAPQKEVLRENQLSFLNGVYLYCTVNTGSCPFLLEAIYEIDFLNAKAAGSATCPLMTQFWKLWIKNEMESRQSYLVKTSNITVTSEFTSKVRPKFIKCLDTVKEDLTSNKGITATASVQKTLQILNTLKEKRINVFNATGSYPKTTEGSEPAAKDKN